MLGSRRHHPSHRNSYRGQRVPICSGSSLSSPARTAWLPEIQPDNRPLRRQPVRRPSWGLRVRPRRLRSPRLRRRLKGYFRPQRRAQADIQQVKGLCLLAISVSAPGRTFPIWRLAVGAKEKLSKVMSMWASKHLGCGNLPEGVCAFAGNGGPPLDLRDRLQQMAPMLPVRDARLAVAVTWPALPPQEAMAAVTVRSSTSHSKLGKLAISTRYSSVDREAMGYHQSSNYDSKVEAGEYDETFGQYLQAGYIEAMRTPPASDADAAREAEESIETLELSVFSKVSDQVVFTATLRGPKALVDNWGATCEAFEHKKEECQDLPFPVFIPSRGRPLKANLNWEASHVYGDLLREDETKTLRPVVYVALEQEDEPEYRQV